MWLNTHRPHRFRTLRHGKSDAAATGLAKDFKPIDYPKPDGKLSFDRLTNVAFSFTNHDENQPAHLVLKDPSVPIQVNLPKYDANPPSAIALRRLRSAGRRPGRDLPDQLPELRPLQDLRHQGPSQNIVWTTPMGGGGPNYPNM